jgi:hypothetical protein
MIVSLAPRRAAPAPEAPADGEARRPDSSEEAGADAPAETDAEPMPAAEPMEEPAEEMTGTDTSA